MWYGNVGKADKMQKGELKKEFQNNLLELDFFNGNNLSSEFNYAEYKRSYKPEDPNILKLFT